MAASCKLCPGNVGTSTNEAGVSEATVPKNTLKACRCTGLHGWLLLEAHRIKSI